MAVYVQKNNIFIAFALWAGAWNILEILQYVTFELYAATQDSTQGLVFGSLDDWPALAGFIALILVAHAWKSSISILLLAFMALDIFWALLSYADASVFFLLCPPNVCTWDFQHDFQSYNTALGFLGYMLAAIVIQTWRIGLTSNGSDLTPRNPLAYIAAAIARLGTKLMDWLEIDRAEIPAFWSRWANLPLWRSGSFLTRNIRPVWIAFFALVAASTLAFRCFQTLMPFWNLLAVGDVVDETNSGAVWSLFLYMLLLAATCWKAGKLSSEFGWRISAWAAIPATLVASFFALQVSIDLIVINRSNLSPFIFLLAQNLGEITILYLGFVFGHRWSHKQAKTIAN